MMNYTNTESTSPLARRKWRIRHSAWLLAPILGMGFFSFVGFLYVALRVRKRKFWIACAIACLGSALVAISTSIWNERNGNSSTGGGVIMAVWVGLVVFAMVLNRDYLRWRASRTEANAWYNQQGAKGMQGPAAPAPGPGGWTAAQQAHSFQPSQPMPPGPGAAFLGVNNSPYYAPPTGQPPVTAGPSPIFTGVNNTPPYAPPVTPPFMPPAQQKSTAQEATKVAPLDVNTASGSDLATVLGIDPALANRVVATRRQQGPYRDLGHLAATAGLQPHELLKFRSQVTFEQAQKDATQNSPTPSVDLPFGVRPLDY
jgi:uncharacterized membrane protein YsdA (DUF1294 family)